MAMKLGLIVLTTGVVMWLAAPVRGFGVAQRAVFEACSELIPVELPPVDDVIDQVSFAEDLRDLSWREVQGTALLSIRLSPGQTQPQPVMLETSLGEAIAGRLERLVGARLRPRQSEHVWGVLLDVRIDHAVDLSVERSAYCPPRVRRASPSIGGRRFLRDASVSRFLPPVMGGSMDPVLYGLSYNIPVRVEVLVGENGQVAEAQLRGTTHSQLRDKELLQAAFFGRYQPAMLDGLPIEESLCWIMRAGRRPHLC